MPLDNLSKHFWLCREHLTENYYDKDDLIDSIPVVITEEPCNKTTVRNAMIKDFVPNYLGAKRFSREQWLEQNTEMVKTLFYLDDNQLAIIADGTYCYCQKSSNNMIQRKIYSGHKNRPHV
ncbi:Vacuolar sorting-associated 13C [Brachionus plicatilis]|uniref:Vacuolar sorting-associated 13C n=1 Tax=Brachionus plicatilis TaxID=10195 RepID=A0A3M7PFN6_BRAPC|nr:Vacuolar sorting-associated 13C [Brachionus plicatilis]